jgi:pimeloyl-ACP methyl ester carboxylesterase
MSRAVQQFFSLQLVAAAESIDEAYRALHFAADEEDSNRRDRELDLAQAMAYRVKLNRQVADVASGRLHVTLVPFYGQGWDAAEAVNWQALISLDDMKGNRVHEETLDIAAISQGCELAWRGDVAGDYRMTVSLNCNEEDKSPPGAIVVYEGMVSRVDRLQDRLFQLESQLATRGGQQQTDETETARLLVGLVKQGISGVTLETTYPWDRMVGAAEYLLSGQGAVADLVAQHWDQDHWLMLGGETRKEVVRLRLPYSPSQETHEGGDQVEGTLKSYPVLIAFHGAGGSENMFFEAYGAGGLVRRGLERNWLVVAPRLGLMQRQGDLDSLLDALEGLVPIDRGQVFMVGHSMGAGQVARIADEAPGSFTAAAAIGGGGSFRNAEGMKGKPWYVAAGEFDFGRSGAKNLAERLKRAGAAVEYEEIADVEHLVIVQAALDRVFRFFERVASTGH